MWPGQGLERPELDLEEKPLQPILGVHRYITGTLHPYTKRGVLATINSLSNPLDFQEPVVVKGNMILRDVMSGKLDWDDPIDVTYIKTPLVPMDLIS